MGGKLFTRARLMKTLGLGGGLYGRSSRIQIVPVCSMQFCHLVLSYKGGREF